MSVLGPTTDLTAPKFDFRFTPESGLKSDIAPCPGCANNGLMHRSKHHRSFDHLVGELLQLRGARQGREPSRS